MLNKPTNVSKITIGIIEDEKDVQDDLVRQVKGMKKCTLDFVACSFKEYLYYFQNTDYCTKVLLLDLHLNTHTGFDIIDMIRAKRRPIKVIVISGYCDALNLLQTKNRGANAHIKKSLLAGADSSVLENIIVKICNEKEDSDFWPITSILNNHNHKNNIKLTYNQKELLKHLISGKSQSSIAQLTGVTESTINNKFLQLRKNKFKVKTNAELVKKVVELGIELTMD